MPTYHFKTWQNSERIRKLVKSIIFERWNGGCGFSGREEEQNLCKFFDRIIKGDVELDYVDFSDVYLSDIDSANEYEKLAKALVKISEVKINYPERNEYILERDNLEAIFREIAETDNLKLRKLSIAENFVCDVKVETLASAVIRLEMLKYKSAHLPLEKKQIHAMINKIACARDEDLKLKRLDVEPGELTLFEPKVLTSVFTKIDLILENSYEKFTPTQLQEIFKAIAADEAISYKIENLGYGIELNHVSPEILATVIVRQKKFNFENKMTPSKDHMEAILTKIVEANDLQLKEISMGKFTFPDYLNSDLLSRAFIRMEAVNLVDVEITPDSPLSNANISQDKVMNIFTTILMSKDLKLKKLQIRGNFSQMSSETLTQAISKLEVVTLRGSDGDEEKCLSKDQIHEIFKIIAERNTMIRNLDLKENDISKVDPKIISEAAVKLETLNLTKTSVTKEQMVGIFEKVLKTQDMKLKKLLYFDEVLTTGLNHRSLFKEVQRRIEIIFYINPDPEEVEYL